MRVIVTRPERDAQRWVQDLSQRGLQALALPLIDICPAANRQAVVEAWHQLDGCAAAMFVSGNAVEEFFRARPEPTARLFTSASTAPRAWATGPGTAGALLAAGVAPSLLDAPPPDAPQFDSEALWRVVQGQAVAGARMLIVRGSDSEGRSMGRDWFASQLESRGCTPAFVVAYERHVPQWTQAQREQAQGAAADGSVWLFSSSEAIANLLQLLPGQDWRQARAVATHARIAQAAREAGFAVVCESRPALDSVVASIESSA
ncbi:MAG: uroporphyrinogen-III synthase [Bdellovibrionales bacterium]|nr:uroporphyrinogen-III synthase [Ramlibacter sp.]